MKETRKQKQKRSGGTFTVGGTIYPSSQLAEVIGALMRDMPLPAPKPLG
jgi:hypothetical protein